MTRTENIHHQFDRLQHRAFAVGLAALAVLVGGVLLNSEQFFRSYLLAYVFWIGIALGSLAIVMLHHLVGGAWGSVIRRLLEAGTRTLPLMTLLFIPILFGLHDLYLWARPDHVAADQLLQHKSLYLNIPFFVIRNILYFAVWIVTATFLNRWSFEHDRTGEPILTRRLRLLSGPGLVLYGLTVTFASIDWVMSLEPDWFSTIYGILFIVGQGLTTLAFVIPAAVLLADRQPLSKVIAPTHFHDLGNLLLSFVVLWAYIAFSQYLIIWSGNLPEEIPWILRRTTGGWEWIGLFLVPFHFVLPFLLLLSRGTKRSARMLFRVAVLILFMRIVDLFWIVVPAFLPTGLAIHWMDLAAFIGVGGMWLAVFVRQLKARPLLPLHDPRLREAVHHG
jgi:hypothetical protein